MPATIRHLLHGTTLIGFLISPVAVGQETGPLGPVEPFEYREAVIEPAKAKDVPAMRITLSAGTLKRTESGYTADYRVDVFPFFFFSESGSVHIDVSPESMGRLQSGQVISVSGKAINNHDRSRRLEGRVYPDDLLTGRIRLVVYVGRIELIFKTTYRFQGQKEE